MSTSKPDTLPSKTNDKYAALLRKSEELVMERDALRRTLERHIRFRTRVIALLKDAEIAFEQVADAAGGEPQYLVHRQISEFLTEADQRIKRATAETSDDCEFFNQLSQLLNGWKQGCAPGEWSAFDESVLQQWEAYKARQRAAANGDASHAKE
jgi:hypothetical protein